MNNKYDTIIIGAGIGGLVCGCYLAKTGMNVLIIEKNHNVGGYCVSFRRKRFIFDACIHYLGSCRENGQIGKILKDLNINKKVSIARIDPSDVVITPEYKISFRNNLNETIENFQREFPHQRREVESFFKFIAMPNFVTLYAKLRKYQTFSDILDDFFCDYKIKGIIGILLSNAGLPPSKASAITAVTLYREFVLDGGYYPQGGMQKFADAFSERFQAFGGKILLQHHVKKITINKNCVRSVTLQNGEKIFADFIVSNCDARQTYFQLIDRKFLTTNFIKRIENMIPSASAFMVYLGFNRSVHNYINRCGGLWIHPAGYITEDYLDITRNKGSKDKFVFCSFPCPESQEIKSMHLIIGASFKNKKFWEVNKYKLADELISRVQKIIPGFNLSEHIVVKETATPQTLFKSTLNYQGAMFGWASIPSQAERISLIAGIHIKGLYLCGHWTKLPGGQGGIPMVASSGRLTAKKILYDYNQQ